MPARKSTAPKPEKNKSHEQWIWDAACGSGGLLIKNVIAPKEWGHSCPKANGKQKNGDRNVATPLKLYGQNQWEWGSHLRRAQRARRVRERRKLPNQYGAELDAIEAEAKETDKALRKILKQLGI
jgi:hypothetical protein